MLWLVLHVLRAPLYLGIGVGENPVPTSISSIHKATDKVMADVKDKKVNDPGAITELEGQLEDLQKGKDYKSFSTELKQELNDALDMLESIRKRPAGSTIPQPSLNQLAQMAVSLKASLNTHFELKDQPGVSKYADHYARVIELTPKLQVLADGPDKGPPGALAEAATTAAMLGLRDDLNNTNLKRPTPIQEALIKAFPALDKSTLANLMNPDKTMAEKYRLLKDNAIPNPGAVLQKISDITQQFVQSESGKIYGALGGQPPMPQNLILGTGDGSTTKGLLGQTNAGIGLFAYACGPKNVDHSNSGTFHTQGQDWTAVHLNVMGMDFDNPSKVTINKGNQEYAFDTKKGISKKGIKIDSIQPALAQKGADGSFNPPNGALKDTPAPGLWKFKDGSVFDSNTQNMTFATKDQSDFKVSLSSAKKDAYEEIQLMVSVVKGQEPARTKPEPKPLDLTIPDSFTSDDFTLNKDKLQISEDKVNDLADTLIYNPGTKITTTLTAGGIGMNGPAGKTVADPKKQEKTTYADTGATRDDSKNAGLRCTQLNGKYDPQANELHLDVSSFVDPVQSNLDQKFKEKPDILKKYFQGVTPHKQDYKGAGTPVTNNDVLCGLRTFAVLESLQEKLVDKLKSKGLAEDEARAKVKGMLDNATVPIGGRTYTYEDFKTLRDALPKPNPSQVLAQH